MSILCYFSGALALAQAKEEGSIGHAIAGVVIVIVGVAMTILM